MSKTHSLAVALTRKWTKWLYHRYVNKLVPGAVPMWTMHIVNALVA